MEFNNKRKGLILFSAIAAFILVLWLFELYKIDSFSLDQNLKANNQNNGNSRPIVKDDGSATSGKLFDGKITRDFTFPRFFDEESKFSTNEKARPLSSFEGIKSLDHCKSWGVVTTIFHPTESISAVASLEGFCVVVATDKKTPKDYKVDENVIVLSVEYQEKMKDDFSSDIPWNHIGRKNIGFLFAIKQKPQFIFDFDDDNLLKKVKSLGDGKVEYRNLDVKGSTVNIVTNKNPNKCLSVNVYTLSKPSNENAWPRGFPLLDLRNPDCAPEKLSETISHDKVAIYQILQDHDPDVDAIYRLTQPLPLYFKQGSNDMLTPAKGLYTPFNTQSALYAPPSFWSLYLPITVHGRVSDIYRGYIAQRLFQDLGYSVAFTASWINQFRNPHNYLGDLDSEHPLYVRGGVLLDFISSWKGKTHTLPGRIEELWIELYKRQYIEIEDVYLTQKWIKECLSAGYKFPAIIEDTDSYKRTNKASLERPTTENRNQLKNVVLCIMFNFHFGNDLDLYLYNFHSNYFSEVILIIPAPDSGKIDQFYNDNSTGITYFYCNNPNGGIQGYYCLGQLMRKHDTEIGYLFINDDVAFIYSSLLEMNLQNIWYQVEGAGWNFPFGSYEYSPLQGLGSVHPYNWGWWFKEDSGLKAVGRCFESQEFLPEWKTILGQRFGAGNYHAIQEADVFYVPRRFSVSFTKYSDVFFRYGVFLEIATINIFALILAEHDCYDCWENPLVKYNYYANVPFDPVAIVHSLETGEWKFWQSIKMSANKPNSKENKALYEEIFRFKKE